MCRLESTEPNACDRYIFIEFDQALGPSKTRADANTIPTFLTLYIFAFLYQLILVWDALRRKNTIQIIGLVGLNVGLFVYGGVQYAQISRVATARAPMIALPCVIAFFTVGMAYAAYKLYNEFAWTIYKQISADLRLKRRYLTYQIYVALLKFDFFFCLGFTIQFVVIVGGSNTAEKYLTIAAIPVTILIMLAAFWVTRRESLVGSIGVILLYFAGLTYFCFKLGRMYTPSREEPYLPARKELTTFAVLTILLLVCTIIVACLCAHNYGKGLMPYVRSQRSQKGNAQDSFGGSSSNGYGDYRPGAYHSQGNNTELSSDGYTGKPGRPLAPTRMEID